MSTLTIPDAAASGALDGFSPDTAPVAPTSEGAVAAPVAPVQPEPRGFLLDEPDAKKVVQRIEKLWKAQDKRLNRLISQWDANELTVQGVPGVRTAYDPEKGGWFARIPVGAAERVGPSKTAELIQKTTSTLLADPPVPDAQPADDTSEAREAAELSTRILVEQMGEQGLHLQQRAADASNLSGTHGSAFDVFTVDPQGGGWAPLQIKAHPGATTYDPANPDAVLADPVTGELSDQYVTRYVQPGGALSASPAGAQKQWTMAVRAERVTGRQLRFLPQTATSIDDADGVLLARATPFGQLCSLFPQIRKLPPEQQKALVTWRPVDIKKIVPRDVELDGGGMVYDESGLPSDDAMVVTLAAYYKSHAAYPEGAYVCVGGGDQILFRDDQCVTLNADDPDGDDTRDVCLLLPVAQCAAFRDPKGGNPYATADAEPSAPGDEIRQQIMAGIVERLWQQNNRNVFMDMASTVQSGQLAQRDGSPILTNLAAGQPAWEDVPPVEPAQFQAYELLGVEMEGRFGLEAAAQGQAATNVTSGKQQQQVVEQALVMLTQRKNNLDAYLTRSWRILVQLYRCYATTPTVLRYAGDYGGTKVRHWRGVDLGDTVTVQMRRGTGTMQTRSAKVGVLRDEFALAAQVDPGRALRTYQRAVSGNLVAVLGEEPNAHRDRIRSQIGAWFDGPPEGLEQYQPQLQPPPMPPVDPMTGQPVAPVGPPPAPADARAIAALAMLPCDQDPDVARVRYDALTDAMASSAWKTQPPPWQQGFVLAWQDAKQAAGVASIPEQQQAQAQAQQQQLQAKQQQAQQALGAKQQGDAAARQHEASQADQQRQHESDQSARAAELALSRQQMQNAAKQNTGGAPQGPPTGGM